MFGAIDSDLTSWGEWRVELLNRSGISLPGRSPIHVLMTEGSTGEPQYGSRTPNFKAPLTSPA